MTWRARQKTLKGPITIDQVVKLIEKSFIAFCKKERKNNIRADSYLGHNYYQHGSLRELYRDLENHKEEYQANRKELEASVYLDVENYLGLFKIDIINTTKIEDILNGQIMPSAVNEYSIMINAEECWNITKKFNEKLDAVIDQMQERIDELRYGNNVVRIEIK